MRKFGSQQIWQQKRLWAMEKLSGGTSLLEVALQLKIQMATLKGWVRRFHDQGPGSLLAKAHPGNPRPLPNGLREKIQFHLDQSPRKSGLKKDFWDGPSLVHLLDQQFDIQVHPKSIYRWVRSHQLGSDFIRKWTKTEK